MSEIEYKYDFEIKPDPKFPADKFELVKPGDIIKEGDTWETGYKASSFTIGGKYSGLSPLYRPIVKENKELNLTPAKIVRGKLYRHKNWSDTYYLGCQKFLIIIRVEGSLSSVGMKVASYSKHKAFWRGFYEN